MYNAHTCAAAQLIPFHLVQMMDQVLGVNGMTLPWEDPNKAEYLQAKLGIFRDTVLQLVHRDPERRLSMDGLVRKFSQIFSLQSTLTAPQSRQQMVRNYPAFIFKADFANLDTLPYVMCA